MGAPFLLDLRVMQLISRLLMAIQLQSLEMMETQNLDHISYKLCSFTQVQHTEKQHHLQVQQ